MSSSSSHRPDSAIALQDTEIIQLNRAIAQVHLSEEASRNECGEWKMQYADQKAEALRPSGLSVKHARQVNELQEQCSDANARLSDEVKKVDRLRGELSEAQKRIRQTELQLEASEDISYQSCQEATGRTAFAELESLRSQFNHLQQEHSKLKQVHADANCEEALRTAGQDVTNAKILQKAAEAETEAYRHLGKANELMKEQIAFLQTQLIQSTSSYQSEEAEQRFTTRERQIETDLANAMKAEEKSAELEAKLVNTRERVNELETELGRAGDRVVELETELTTAEDKATRLEAELTDERVQIVGLDAELVRAGDKVAELQAELELQAKLSQRKSSLSNESCYSTSTASNGLAANIVINIDPRDRRNWTLLQRAQSTISKASQFDIIGPHDTVTAFLAEMKRLEDDHADKTSSAAHWQNVAQECLTKLNCLRSELNNRPLCSIASHRSLTDELEAKDFQLQMQATLVAHWQKKAVAVRTFFDQSNLEMRAAGVQGV